MENVNKTTISGPFGNYEWGTAGAILNAAVRNEHLPLYIVECSAIGEISNDGIGVLKHGGEVICRYKWFKGINYPIFQWMGKYITYRQHTFILFEDNKLKANFRLSLSSSDTVALVIADRQATPSLHKMLKSMITDDQTDPCYEISKNAGAVFRYVRRRPMSIRSILRCEKLKNRVKMRPIKAMIKDLLKLKRGRFLSMNKARRQNFNELYMAKQIR